jgi:hypothetical protein
MTGTLERDIHKFGRDKRIECGASRLENAERPMPPRDLSVRVKIPFYRHSINPYPMQDLPRAAETC